VLGGKQYTPEQISSEILKKMKEEAEEKLGDEVTHAVITVPAYFTEKQKNATRIAAQLAGLKVQKLLAEPTAAAIAYGVDNMKTGESKTVIIYDFGGGTFDLSILNIVDGQYMEAGTGGDRWLGGDDLDRKLQEVVLEKVSTQYKINDIKSIIENLPDKKRHLFEEQIKYQTEAAKIQLSSSKTASISIDNILEDENGDLIDIDVTIKREEFEMIAKPFIERTIDLIGVLLKEVGYDMSMIDSILLVGGTSCIPLVKQMLSEKFGADKIMISEKPMLAVAEGAAILSHRLGDEYEIPTTGETYISEISYSTNHNYFIELIDDEYDRIIEKQMPLPCYVSKPYKTTVNNQKVVKIGIYADVESGRKEIQTMGFFTIEDDLPIGSDIILDITLGIDEIFDVMAYPRNHKSKSKKIVLGRGNKDSSAFNFLSQYLEKILSKDFSEKQRDFFFKSAKKEIEKINSLGTENPDSEKWEEIGTNIFLAFEQAERITDTVDEDKLAEIYANILVNEYPDLIGSEVTHTLQRFLNEIKNEDDPLHKINAKQKLKEMTDSYLVLIELFFLKIVSDKVIKSNPSDGHRLLQMHDQIVNHFRHGRKNEAFALLNEGLELCERYIQKGTDFGSILLRKS